MVSMARFIQAFEIVLFQIKKKLIDELESKKYFSSHDFILQVMKIIRSSMAVKESLQYARGNAERLKLPSASFDLVTIM